MSELRLSADDIHNEKGAALPLIAGTLLVLIGLAALAVDLGWLYLNDSRLQRAADAAALAGVVYLPGDTAKVEADAAAAAAANGFPIGVGDNSMSWRALADNRLEVTLRSSAPSFLSRTFGFTSYDLTAVATAEYVKPVPMGSPNNEFGVGTDNDQLFWAAISGPYTNKWNGDAKATRWWSSGGWSPGSRNDNHEYRPGGYYYGIEVTPGMTNVDLLIYDAGFYERDNFNHQTGDLGQDTGGGADTHYKVYNWDSTPLDPTDNPPLSGCEWFIPSGNQSATYRNRWVKLCDLPSTPGIYVLRVWTTGDDGGTNQYAIRATANGPDPRVYGINDISIFTNQSGVSTLNIAEVDKIHAGKTLELRFYDPGEDDDDAYMTVVQPGGSTATCDWIAENENEVVTDSGSGACRIQTSDGESFFNGQWITANVEIPAGYSCTSDCWWTMKIENDQPHDRTTWAARVIGNPVRLVPNE